MKQHLEVSRNSFGGVGTHLGVSGNSFREWELFWKEWRWITFIEIKHIQIEDPMQ